MCVCKPDREAGEKIRPCYVPACVPWREEEISVRHMEAEGAEERERGSERDQGEEPPSVSL